MRVATIASFESKNRGPVEVRRGYNGIIAKTIYAHSSDPGIVRTLGSKDLGRFNPVAFPEWIAKGGGRFLYTAWNAGHLAGTFWIGGEQFPRNHFPEATVYPPYTAAWRTGYSLPEDHTKTFEGQGIGKRLALASIADVVALTSNGGPRVTVATTVRELLPLREAGLWIDTGEGNTDGQDLYHHLGNTSRDQEPIGFHDIDGIYTPPFKEGATELELESRVGMVADAAVIEQFLVAAQALIQFT